MIFIIREKKARISIPIENFLSLFLAEKEIIVSSVPIVSGIKKERILNAVDAGR